MADPPLHLPPSLGEKEAPGAEACTHRLNSVSIANSALLPALGTVVFLPMHLRIRTMTLAPASGAKAMEKGMLPSSSSSSSVWPPLLKTSM